VACTYKDIYESSDSNEVQYKYVNQPPTENALVDQAISANTLITLDGSRFTDPDGTLASYKLTQTAGSSVTLANATGAKPSFTAPNVATLSTMDFKLTVSDPEGLSPIDIYQVALLPVTIQDSDDDGLSDEDEKQYGTDPNNSDIDGDGFSDGDELNAGTDPVGEDSTPDSDNPITDIEVIIDNGAKRTTSIGNWRLSAGPAYHESQPVYSNKSEATYTYEKQIIGTYDVALCWTYYNNRCPSIPVEIYDCNQLVDTVHIDQLKNDAQWNSLGFYDFTSTKKIVFLSEGGCTTNADAVKLFTDK
jgi:archaellin